MIAKNNRQTALSMCIALVLGLFTAGASAQDQFKLYSTTFSSDTTLPLTTIFNNQVNGVNSCTPNGAAGYDESPNLFWTGAPQGTRSFVIVLYDVTASFTHWGMYNISGSLRQLPENAGKTGSAFGSQILNDFGVGEEYDGPCPPANVAPDTHQYRFTIYALSTTLTLPGTTNFPNNAETLYHALIRAEAHGEVLGKASLTGLYSSTPPAQ